MRPVGPGNNVDPEDTLIPSHPDDDPDNEPNALGIFRAVFVGAVIVLALFAVFYIMGKRI